VHERLSVRCVLDGITLQWGGSQIEASVGQAAAHSIEPRRAR